jgi:predicted dehydrogenase
MTARERRNRGGKMLNAAVAGLGWWGKTIVATLRDSANLRVVMAIDPDPAAAAWAREHGLDHAGTLDAALTDDVIQAVILCTPHSLHAEQIVRAAQAKKHVFCEKPLALKRADAVRAIEACRENGVMLGVGHERRFEPPMIELTRLAKSGAFGILLQIEASFCQDKFLDLPAGNWRMSQSEAPAGPMTATGIHLLDLAVSLFGPAESALARTRQLGSALTNGDTLAALVSFKSGAALLLNAILATPFAGRFTLYGNKGWGEVRDLSHVENPKGWVLTTCLRGGEQVLRDYPPAPAVKANLESFADAAAGKSTYPMTHEEMIATVAALEAIVTSSRSGTIAAVA